MDYRTRKVLEDCNEILSMNRIESKRVTVKNGLNKIFTVSINDEKKASTREVEEGHDHNEHDTLDSNEILKQARQALERAATESILDVNGIGSNGNYDYNTNDDDDNANRSKLTSSGKATYNNDANNYIRNNEEESKHVSLSKCSNTATQGHKRLDEALRKTVRRALFTF